MYVRKKRIKLIVQNEIRSKKVTTKKSLQNVHQTQINNLNERWD